MREPTWQSDDGSIRLYHGDCLDILSELGPVDAVITDPPYGVNLKETRTKHRVVKGGYLSTDDSPEAVLRVVVPAIEACRGIANRVLVTPGTRLLQRYPPADDVGAIFFPSGTGLGRWGFICAHPILYYGKCPYLAARKGSRPNGVSATHWKRRKDAVHPCEKPLQMMEWLVNRGTLTGDSVLDPFMGSGTTGVACVLLKRRFIGIEKDERYFTIALNRIKAELSRHPLLEATA